MHVAAPMQLCRCLPPAVPQLPCSAAHLAQQAMQGWLKPSVKGLQSLCKQSPVRLILCSGLCTRSNSAHLAGTLFWKWGLSPKNPRTDYLEVAVPDPTFTDIVVPGAKAALDWAKKASPLKDCKKVRGPRP